MKLNPIGIFAGLLFYLGFYFIHEYGKEVFRAQDIASCSHTWNIAPLSRENQDAVDSKLQQKYYYLASGEQCHAFLGEDKKTVLKFFRQGNPISSMESCKLAYENLPELSGILYLHFNPTHHLHGKVKILDASYIEHEVDLDTTPFLVQHYGELIFKRIDRQMLSGDLQGAQASINIFLNAIRTWACQGFHIDNPVIKRNMGYYGDQLILLDTGSISKVDPTPEHMDTELRKTSARLRRWLYNHYPELHAYFLDQI